MTRLWPLIAATLALAASANAQHKIGDIIDIVEQQPPPIFACILKHYARYTLMLRTKQGRAAAEKFALDNGQLTAPELVDRNLDPSETYPNCTFWDGPNLQGKLKIVRVDEGTDSHATWLCLTILPESTWIAVEGKVEKLVLLQSLGARGRPRIDVQRGEVQGESNP